MMDEVRAQVEGVRKLSCTMATVTAQFPAVLAAL